MKRSFELKIKWGDENHKKAKRKKVVVVVLAMFQRLSHILYFFWIYICIYIVFTEIFSTLLAKLSLMHNLLFF